MNKEMDLLGEKIEAEKRAIVRMGCPPDIAEHVVDYAFIAAYSDVSNWFDEITRKDLTNG